MSAIWGWLFVSPALAQTTLVDPGAPSALLGVIPQPYSGYLTTAFAIFTAAVTFAAAVVALFPAPVTTSGVWYAIYSVVNRLAGNMGHGQSLAAPTSAGIVGGPTATSAPLIATSVVPLVTATPAQLAVTVVPAVLPTPATPPPVPTADVVAGAAAAAAFEAKKATALPSAPLVPSQGPSALSLPVAPPPTAVPSVAPPG